MANLRNLYKYILLSFCLFICVTGYSQKNIEIKVENTPCVKCNCSFFKGDSLLYKALTNEKGIIVISDTLYNNYNFFELEVGRKAKCRLDRTKISDPHTITCTSKDIENMKTTELEEVIIFAKKNIIEDEGDKLVYNVKKDIITTSVTTTDVLRKTPMISVDVNGSPAIKGDKNIRILINGKEVHGLLPNQILEQIPAGEIEKIEVITSPSSKYESEGGSGLINIITQKKIIFKSSGYVNLGIGTKGSHLFTNYNYNLNKHWSIANSFNSLLSYTDTENNQKYTNNSATYFQKESDGSNHGQLYSYQLAVSQTSDKEKFNIYLNYYSQNFGLNETFEINSNTAQNKSKTKNRYSYYKFATDYENKITENYKINLSSSIFYLPINNRIQTDNLHNKYEYSIINNTNAFSLETSFAKRFTSEIGFKSILNFFKNENISQYPELEKSADQMTLASYWDNKYKLSNKINFNFGLRFENYLFNNSPLIHKNYENLFFNGNLNYKINNKNTLSFLFSQRTQQPSYSALIPIQNYTSSNVSSIGNPDLNQGISYNYEIGFSTYIEDHFFKISPFYRHIKDKISNLLSVDKYIFYTHYINLDYENDWGVSVWSSLNFFSKKLNINYGLDIINKKLRFAENKSEGTQFLNNLNITYKISSSFYMNLFGAFNSPDIYLQGKENSYTYSNLSLQKDFYKDNLKVALSVDNPFSKGFTYKQKYTLEGYAYTNNLTYLNRGIRLFVIYKFGNNKKIQDTDKNIFQKDILN